MDSEKNKIRALVSQGKINKSRLSPNRYTISLLNEGLRTGMLNSREVYDIQSEWMLILKNLIRRYTRGESSSVASETAEGILASILYATDAYMLRFDDPEKAIAYLKTFHIREIYEEGVDVVRQCFEETKQLYREIKSNKLDVAVDAYHMTIDESLPVFLDKYEIIFDAHNTMASIDYPLAIDDMRIQGVFYIRQYLERLKMETKFCGFFSKQDLQQTLVNFGRICGFDYRIELFNIFQLMLNNAVFSVLSGGKANQVHVSTCQYKRLERLFTHLDASRIRFAVHKAVDHLLDDLNIRNIQMAGYINQCTNDLIQRVINAARHNSLQTVIITEKEEKPKSIVVSFKEADRMSDSRFRLLVEKIRECQETEDKIQLIRANFHSLQDYIDMLNADCLFAGEYTALFNTFGDMELAILSKIVFYEELRGDVPDFSSPIVREKKSEAEWQMHYIQFIQSLSKGRITSIAESVHDIDYEEIKFY
ncbi:DUF6179 domain-containing protein [Paenactinomyces guangxiensis]|nr:DUF6179 domain-containing protein [Paenactinomyces guangxiensis]